MKFFIALCAGCFLNLICKAQVDSTTSTGKAVIEKIKQLQQNKIDTVVCYYINCVGYMVTVSPPDTCIAYDETYLIWMNDNKCFIQKFDQCKNHEPVLMSPQFLYLIRNNYLTIRKSEIKNPQYMAIINKKPKLLDVIQDHSCHNIFEIHAANKIMIKDIDDFALNTKYIDDRHLNRNYARNQKSLLNKLKIIIEKEVKSLN